MNVPNNGLRNKDAKSTRKGVVNVLMISKGFETREDAPPEMPTVTKRQLRNLAP